jgi:hypothetical protein
MWILNFLTDSLFIIFINILLLVGIVGVGVGYFTKFIPVVNNYRTPILVVSFILILISTYYKGGFSVEEEWRAKVEQLQIELAKAETKSEKANVEIQTKYITKTKIVHDIVIETQREIIENEKIIDRECVIPPEAIDILNKSARGNR